MDHINLHAATDVASVGITDVTVLTIVATSVMNFHAVRLFVIYIVSADFNGRCINNKLTTLTVLQFSLWTVFVE